jgi:hypothetical protein
MTAPHIIVSRLVPCFGARVGTVSRPTLRNLGAHENQGYVFHYLHFSYGGCLIQKTGECWQDIRERHDEHQLNGIRRYVGLGFK